MPIRENGSLVVEVSLKLHDREMAGAVHDKIIGIHLNEVAPVISLGRFVLDSALTIILIESINDRGKDSSRVIDHIKDLGVTVNLVDVNENRIPEDGLVSLNDIIAVHTVQAPLSGVKREGRRIEIVIGTTNLALGEVGGEIIERKV